MMERLYNRVRTMFGAARITATDDTGPSQSAQVQWSEVEARDDTPVLYHYGYTSRPQPGCNAIVASFSGDRSNSVVIATGDARYRLKALQAGEVAIHDDQGQVVILTRNGIEIRGGGKQVTIKGTPKLRIEADVEVTGDVVASGKSLVHHKHTQTQPGSGLSGEPQ